MGLEKKEVEDKEVKLRHDSLMEGWHVLIVKNNAQN